MRKWYRLKVLITLFRKISLYWEKGTLLRKVLKIRFFLENFNVYKNCSHFKRNRIQLSDIKRSKNNPLMRIHCWMIAETRDLDRRPIEIQSTALPTELLLFTCKSFCFNGSWFFLSHNVLFLWKFCIILEKGGEAVKIDSLKSANLVTSMSTLNIENGTSK